MSEINYGMSMDLARTSDSVADDLKLLRRYTALAAVPERRDLERDARMLEAMARNAVQIREAALELARRFKLEHKHLERLDRVAAIRADQQRLRGGA